MIPDLGPTPLDAGPRDAGPAPTCAAPCARFATCISGACVDFAACPAAPQSCAAGEVCRNARCIPSGLDPDQDGATAGVDCDEDNPARTPNAAEVCNDLDDDCDGVIDEAPGAPQVFYRDADADGFGDPAATVTSCLAVAGYVGNAMDCNDAAFAVRPAAPELCNSVDEDCDGVAAEGCPVGCTTVRRAAHDYLVCSGSRSWTAAQTVCAQEGYRLARIDDGAENNYVVNQIVNVLGTAAPDRIWVGGNDVATEARWVWPDNARFWQGESSGAPVGTPAPYTRWNTDEPNDSSSSGDEDCLAIDRTAQNDWLDDDCPDPWPFVCEAW